MKHYKDLTLLACTDSKTNEQKFKDCYGKNCTLYMSDERCAIVYDKGYLMTSKVFEDVRYYENESEKIMILTTLNSEYYFRVYFKD